MDPGPDPLSIRRAHIPSYMSNVYWFATSNEALFNPYWPLPESVAYIKGQKEQGANGYVHWQLVLVLRRKQRLSFLKAIYPGVHFEQSRSAAADEYVWKDDTAIAGTRFELGKKPFRRNSRTDWASVRKHAECGDLSSVPDDIYIRYYSSLKRIGQDLCVAPFVDRSCTVFVGTTGTGKSHRAWCEAGLQAYPKDPLTKWWCGYQAQEHVIIDEFRGIVSIAHLLRWLDRYPVMVETKGGTRPLMARKFWITSNVKPEFWYLELDEATRNALMRRIEVIEMNDRYIPESE